MTITQLLLSGGSIQALGPGSPLRGGGGAVILATLYVTELRVCSLLWGLGWECKHGGSGKACQKGSLKGVGNNETLNPKPNASGMRLS